MQQDLKQEMRISLPLVNLETGALANPWPKEEQLGLMSHLGSTLHGPRPQRRAHCQIICTRQIKKI